MTTGRTGNDYLAGCLDGVKNVMTFAGHFDHLVFFKHSRLSIFLNKVTRAHHEKSAASRNMFQQSLHSDCLPVSRFSIQECTRFPGP